VEKNRKKIIYLTSRNAKDRREWSGTLFYMAKSLEKNSGEVIYVGPYSPKILVFILRVFRKFIEIVFRKKYNINYNYLLVLAYKLHFTSIIKKEKPEIVFAPSASGEMSLLKLDCPIVYLGDITFELLIDNYPNFTNLIKLNLWEANIIERKTYNNAEALVFSSEWAINSAKNFYGIPDYKNILIPYGANMDVIPKREEVINKKIEDKVKILFLGVDWIRKGGDIVYNAFIELLNNDVKAELLVVGCTPPDSYKHENIKVIPFLNKNKEDDFKVLYKILLDTNFLFVPSRSDCTPIAFCEANAFGIPVITSDVGGITSVIKNEINGYTFPLSTDPKKYADIITSFYKKITNYNELVISSRNYYESNLNWDQWGKSMDQLFDNLIENSKSKMK